jgi:uncharacterized protein (TIGR03067 family)
MRFFAVGVALALLSLNVAGLSQAAEFQGDAAKKDLEKLQGSWVLVTGVWDGKKVTDEHTAVSKKTYEGDKITVVTPHQHHEPIKVEIVKMDATKNPKQMHFVRRNGPGAGVTLIAIYEFDGDDVCHMVFDPTGAKTPTELTANEKSGHIKHTWKRLKQ